MSPFDTSEELTIIHHHTGSFSFAVLFLSGSCLVIRIALYTCSWSAPFIPLAEAVHIKKDSLCVQVLLR